MHMSVIYTFPLEDEYFGLIFMHFILLYLIKKKKEKKKKREIKLNHDKGSSKVNLHSKCLFLLRFSPLLMTLYQSPVSSPIKHRAFL